MDAIGFLWWRYFTYISTYDMYKINKVGERKRFAWLHSFSAQPVHRFAWSFYLPACSWWLLDSYFSTHPECRLVLVFSMYTVRIATHSSLRTLTFASQKYKNSFSLYVFVLFLAPHQLYYPFMMMLQLHKNS